MGNSNKLQIHKRHDTLDYLCCGAYTQQNAMGSKKVSNLEVSEQDAIVHRPGPNFPSLHRKFKSTDS